MQTFLNIFQKRSVILLLGPFLFLTLYGYVYHEQLTRSCYRGGDYALTLFEIERAKNFEIDTGPYSRFKFRHPAPTYFYIYSIFGSFFEMSDKPLAQASMVQFVLNSVLLVVSVLALIRIGLSPPIYILPIFYLLMSALIYARTGVLHDIWGPSSVVIPVFVVLCTTPLLLFARYEWSLWCLLCIGLSLSNHIGTAAVILPLFSLVIVGTFLRLLKGTREISFLGLLSIASGIVVVGLMAVLPLKEAYLNGGGNLLKLLSFFFLGNSDQSAPDFWPALRFVGSYLSSFLGFSSWYGAIGFISLFVLLSVQLSVLNGDKRALVIVAIVSLLGGFLGALGIRGDLQHYLMMYQFGVSIFSIFVLISSVDNKVLESSYLKVPILILTLCLGYRAISSFVSSEDLVKSPHGCHVATQNIVDKLSISKETEIRLSPVSNDSWGALAASAYWLYSNRFHFCVAREWGFMFGSSLVCEAQSSAKESRSFRVLSLKKERGESGAMVKSGKVAWLER